MGRVLLGILLASTILLAGCLAPVAPDWGDDISVERKRRWYIHLHVLNVRSNDKFTIR